MGILVLAALGVGRTPAEEGQALLSAREPPDVAVLLVPGAYDSPVRDSLVEAGYRSLLAVPFLQQNRPLGALVVVRRSPGQFSREVSARLQTFAGQCALAIHNARLYAELESQGQALQEASQHKSQFLANMSHELRTPINAMIGYSEMLQEEAEDLGQETLIPDLQKVNAAGKHLLGLINDILDLSKIEAGRMDLFVEDLDIGGLLRDVQAIIQPLVEKNGNALVVDCPEDIGAMQADLTKLRQALFNLLSNAAKFTERGTISLVRAARPRGLAQLRRNGHRHRHDRGAARAALRGVLSGRGIHRRHVRRDRARRGNLCHFCRLMGGDLTVESVFGRGSTFAVWLPVHGPDSVDRP